MTIFPVSITLSALATLLIVLQMTAPSVLMTAPSVLMTAPSVLMTAPSVPMMAPSVLMTAPSIEKVGLYKQKGAKCDFAPSYFFCDEYLQTITCRDARQKQLTSCGHEHGEKPVRGGRS